MVEDGSLEADEVGHGVETELGGGLTTQQWEVDAYLITLGSLILLAGSMFAVRTAK